MAFIPQLPIETFAVTVFPWTSRFDIQRSRSQAPQRTSAAPWAMELRAVVGGRQVLRDSPPHHHLCQRLDYHSWLPSLRATLIARHLPGEFIDQRQRPQGSAVIASGPLDEVVTPNMVRPPPLAIARTNHRSATIFVVSAVSAALSVLLVARSAAPGPYPPAIPLFAIAP